MVQGIGKIQALLQAGKGLFHNRAIFNLEIRELQQGLKGLGYLVLGKSLVPPQHPLEFEYHALGYEQRLA